MSGCHGAAARPGPPPGAGRRLAPAALLEPPARANTSPQAGAAALTVALAGQPNVGKSTIFNRLTGLHQHVGNWPGKTIEQRWGVVQQGRRAMRLVDLPGTYSLAAGSPESQAAREFILHERPDVVVMVADVTALARNLYLLAELLTLPAPVVLALTMLDVAAGQGLRVDSAALETALGLPVVPVAAAHGEGLAALLTAVERVAADPAAYRPARPPVPRQHGPVLATLDGLLNGSVPAAYPRDWVALKLLEGDVQVRDDVRLWVPEGRWHDLDAVLAAHEDALLDVAGERYAWIDRVVGAAVTPTRAATSGLTERLDAVAVHPVLGPLALLAVLGVVFALTYAVAAPVQAWLEASVVDALGGRLTDALAGAPAWLSGLLVDGVLGGAGTVLTFLPVLVIFFAALGVLEDSGYLARVAYVMDRFVQAMGLHGKSVLPLVLGLGCNVPAVMGARILETPSSRLLTILLAPLVPCAARFAVLAFLAPAFFGQYAALVSVGLVALNLAVLAVLGVLLHRLLFKGERAALVMELPLYHRPSARTIGLFVWTNTREFVHKAGTTIMLVSVLIWALSSFPGDGLEESVLGQFGRAIEPLGAAAGLDWRLLVALLASFLAKENAVAALGVLYGAGDEAGLLTELIQQQVPLASALSFLAVEMLFIPCAATLTVMRRETGAWRWPLVGAGLLAGIALLVGVLVYQGAGLLLALGG